MDDEAHQAVPGDDRVHLCGPHRDGIATQDVVQRIILDRGQGQFDDVADEVRKNRAAPTTLRVQVSDVGHRHIVRKAECVVPRLVPIHDGRSKPLRAPFLAVSIDRGHSAPKYLLRGKQAAVMVQSMNADFTAGPTNRADDALGDLVPQFGHERERRSDSVLALECEHRLAEVLPLPGLDIVRHHRARGKPLRPIPNKWDLCLARGLEDQHPQLRDEILDGGVEWPGGERDRRPIA